MSSQMKGNKYTEGWFPVKNIASNMIILDNNEKVAGVKITPRNIFILDEDSQQNIIRSLNNFYNTIDFEFWLYQIELLIYLFINHNCSFYITIFKNQN